MTKSRSCDLDFEEFLSLLPRGFVPELAVSSVDRHVMRSAIARAIHRSLDSISGDVLDVGAGDQPYRRVFESIESTSSYCPLDLHDNKGYSPAEYTWDGVAMPFDDASFDTAVLTEVLEHCPEPEVTLKEVYRVLRPSGRVLVTVPFLWPLHDCPNDEYRYTPWSLERHLERSGFSTIRLWPTGGWDAALAQAIGLWLGRRPMGARRKAVLSWLGVLVMKQLLKSDSVESGFDLRSLLFPGIAGVASRDP